MARRLCLAIAFCFLLAGCSSGPAKSTSQTPDPATGLLLSGRQLTPEGTLVPLGNFPTGGAVTNDGRFFWTVSTGFGINDIRIVDTASQTVIQTIPVPGASGGIALDSANRRAYVSGLTLSRWQPTLYWATTSEAMATPS